MTRTVSILFVTALSLSTTINAASLLPSPFQYPTDPSPKQGDCVSCFRSEKAQGVEQPTVGGDGMATFRIDLAETHLVKHSLLLVSIGSEFSFFPTDRYQIIPPGDKKGQPDLLTARIGDKPVLFKTEVSQIGDVTFRSYNYPGYSIRRDGTSIVLLDEKGRQKYEFATIDNGNSWRLASISNADYPVLKITCEYNKENLLSFIVEPDGNKYSFQYKNGLVSKVTSPDAAVTTIGWDERSHITSIRTILLPGHPFYQKDKKDLSKKNECVVRDIHAQCDGSGYIISIINSFGDKYSFETRSDVDSKTKVSSKVGILTLPDGRRKYCRNVIQTDKTNNLDIGYVSWGQDGKEVFESTESRQLKKKNSTLVMLNKTVKGRKTEFNRDGKTLAITAEKDALGRTTTIRYDENDREVIRVFADGSSIGSNYDDAGRLVEKIDEEGGITTFDYKEGRLVSVNERGALTTYKYNDKGVPVETTMPDGAIHRFAWDDALRLIQHLRPDGVGTVWRYVKGDRKISKLELVSNDGKETWARTFTYEPHGRISSVIYPDGTSEKWEYFCCGIIRAVDKSGAVTTYAYDASRRKVAEISPNGDQVLYAYDNQNNLVKKTRADKIYTEYLYDTFGNKIEERKSDGTWVKFEFDTIGRKISESHYNGTHSFFTYDLRNRLIMVSGDHEKNIEYVHNKIGKIIEEKDFGLPRNDVPRITKKSIDQLGRLSKLILPDGSEVIYLYKGASHRLVASIKNNVVNSLKFNLAGKITAISRYSLEDLHGFTPLERQEIFENNIIEKRTYDIFGNLFEVRKRNDSNKSFLLAARHECSPNGQIISILKPVSKEGAEKLTYIRRYETDGVLITSIYKRLIENPKLSVVDYQEHYACTLVASKLDILPDTKDFGQLISQAAEKGNRKLWSIDATGKKREFFYDRLGRLVKATSDGDILATITYDEKTGRFASTTDILGRKHGSVIDPFGHVIRSTQPDGLVSEFEYDKYGRLISRSGASNYPLSFTYTPYGEIASYTDGNSNTTSFRYDSMKRLIQRIWPDGSTIDYKYHKSGMLASKSESGRVTTYEYNNLNQLVKTTIEQDTHCTTTTMAYSVDNKLIRIADENSAIDIDYNEFGQIVREKGAVGIVEYRYNSAGLLCAKTCSFNEALTTKTTDTKHFTTEYYYDNMNRIYMINSPSGKFSYQFDKNGRIEKLIMMPLHSIGTMLSEYREYDKVGRLIKKWTQRNSEPKELLCSYKYDTLDLRIKSVVNEVKWEYSYDKFNQLITAKSSSGNNFNYEYDQIGNRIQSNNNMFAYNCLNQISMDSFAYDKWGNMNKSPDAVYNYDLNNRLQEVRRNDGSLVRYTYDPFGQRIKSAIKINGVSTVTHFLMSGMVEQARYSCDSQLFHTLGLDIKNNLTSTGAVGAVLATESFGSDSFFYLYDDNGNVIKSLESSLTKATKHDYYPFGEEIVKSDFPFGFSTKVYDSSRLNYYGHRYYSPEFGKWLSRDPIEETGGMNLYTMSGNDTINQFDCFGLLYDNWTWIIGPDVIEGIFGDLIDSGFSCNYSLKCPCEYPYLCKTYRTYQYMIFFYRGYGYENGTSPAWVNWEVRIDNYEEIVAEDCTNELPA